MVALAMAAHGQRRARERDRPFVCGRKIRYLSEMLARNAAILNAWAGRPGMQAYRCPFCLDFHIGHPPKRNS